MRVTPDPALPAALYHPTPHDFAHSGYDRGHLCPSADRDADPGSNSLTFLMTNMQPQLHELNAGPWEDLEKHERELASRPGELGTVHDSLDPDRDGSGQERDGATDGERGGSRADEGPHAGQGRHDLAPFEATDAELHRSTSFLCLICCMVALFAKDESSGET